MKIRGVNEIPKAGIFLLAVFSVAGSEGGTATAQGTVSVYNVEKDTFETVPKMLKSDEEWKKELPPEVYKVTVEKGTEPPFDNPYNANKEQGIYRCVRCGTDLYTSDKKFDSGTGWPSFWAPVADQNVLTRADRSLFTTRTEVLCARCESHLGHLFEDGPKPTGLRYCMNSVALRFVPSKKAGGR